MTTSLSTLADELATRRLIASPEVEDTFVYGLAHFAAVDADVMLNVDPELEENPDLDPVELVGTVERVLALPPTDWSALIERIATEVEEAVGSEPVDETTDLREDLTLMSVVVFVDAVLLSFDAPKQFPDSVIRVQLDDDLAFDDLEIDERDDDGTETITFESVEELMKHLSS
jgi:hypothetical protein